MNHEYNSICCCMLLLIHTNTASFDINNDAQGWVVHRCILPGTLQTSHTLRVWPCRGHLIFSCAWEISKKTTSIESSMICKTMMETVALEHTEVLKNCWSSAFVKGKKTIEIPVLSNFSKLQWTDQAALKVSQSSGCENLIWQIHQNLQSLRLTFYYVMASEGALRTVSRILNPLVEPSAAFWYGIPPIYRGVQYILIYSL